MSEEDSRMSERDDGASARAYATSAVPDGLGLIATGLWYAERPGRLRQSFLEGLVELGTAEVAIDKARNGLGVLMQRLERLGGGRFGDVHKVRYDGQDYAVKEAKDNPAARSAQLTEIIVLKRIFETYDDDDDDDDSYAEDDGLSQGKAFVVRMVGFDDRLERLPYVMELGCGDLWQVIYGDIPLACFQDIIRFLVEVTLGLGAIHSIGAAHCDLKPDNILLVRGSDAALHAKIADLGCARALGAQRGDLTGTLGYIPWECLCKDGATRVEANVFAVGVISVLTVLPEHLRYRNIFFCPPVVNKAEGDLANELVKVAGHVSEPTQLLEIGVMQRTLADDSVQKQLLLPENLSDDVPPSLVEWVCRTFGRPIASDPAERPSLADFREDLLAFLGFFLASTDGEGPPVDELGGGGSGDDMPSLPVEGSADSVVGRGLDVSPASPFSPLPPERTASSSGGSGVSLSPLIDSRAGAPIARSLRPPPGFALRPPPGFPLRPPPGFALRPPPGIPLRPPPGFSIRPGPEMESKGGRSGEDMASPRNTAAGGVGTPTESDSPLKVPGDEELGTLHAEPAARAECVGDSPCRLLGLGLGGDGIVAASFRLMPGLPLALPVAPPVASLTNGGLYTSPSSADGASSDGDRDPKTMLVGAPLGAPQSLLPASSRSAGGGSAIKDFGRRGELSGVAVESGVVIVPVRPPPGLPVAAPTEGLGLDDLCLVTRSNEGMESGSALRGPFLRVEVNDGQGRTMRVVDSGESSEGSATNCRSESLKVPVDVVAEGGAAPSPARFSPLQTSTAVERPHGDGITLVPALRLGFLPRRSGY